MKKHQWYRDDRHQWASSIPFETVSASDLFALDQARQVVSNRDRAWVFDLDSTLFCLAPRIANIYMEFVRSHARPPVHWQKALEFLHPNIQRYSIEETFREIFGPLAHSPEQAQEWAQELWQEFYPFWKEHFFEDRHLHHDVAYPGAASFVQRARERGKKIIYLTGRDRQGSGVGTRIELKKAGFGLEVDDVLLMKPERHTNDVQFKQHAIENIKSRFEIDLLIDNEPENLVMFAERCPESLIVLFHSVMSDRIPVKKFTEALGYRRPLKLLSYEE